MGASTFLTRATGKTAREAFASATSDARYEHGHGGYTGTIAEKNQQQHNPEDNMTTTTHIDFTVAIAIRESIRHDEIVYIRAHRGDYEALQDKLDALCDDHDGGDYWGEDPDAGEPGYPAPWRIRLIPPAPTCEAEEGGDL